MVVVPAAIPVTTPDELMVATVLLLLLHVPPGVAIERVVVLPVQAVVMPVISAPTTAFTVMMRVAVLLPQVLVTV